MSLNHHSKKYSSIKITGGSLAAKYAFFAGVATAANIVTQYLSLLVYSEIYSLYMAMVLGTLIGLALKYVLDREYIFYYRVKTRTDDFTKFVLYSLMGVITTFIFWGVEIGFNLLFKSDCAKYIGAIVGLTIGYIIKFHLDKRFVFQQTHEISLKGHP